MNDSALVYAALAVASLTLGIGGFLVWSGRLKILNPIRAFAVLCVAVISTFVMSMRYWQLEVLSSPDWCNRAMKAEQLAPESRLDAAIACVGLQTIQIKSIATNSFIDGGVIAFCLLTLIVIVIAGGKLALSASKTGVTANIGKDEEQAIAAAGAAQAAGAAKDEANDIAAGAPVDKPEPAKQNQKFTPPPGEEL